MRFKLLVMFGAVLALIQPNAVSAHSNGQSYISVNGAYVVTNPFGGVNGVEDMATDFFVVGQPVQFTVDTNLLTNPGQIYAWRWNQADKEVQTGTSVTHAFSKPGSYVVGLESKVPADTQYREINKIAITIVPSRDYAFPTVQVNATQMSGGTMRYEAVTTHNKDVGLKRVDWTFGDGSKAEGDIVTHRYKDKHDFHLYPSVVVTDSNDIQTYALFQLERRDGKLTASDVPGLPRTVAKSVILSSHSLTYWQLVLVPFIAVIIVLSARRILQRKSR